MRRVKIEKDASKVTVAKQKIVKFKDLTIETANRIVHRGDGKAIDLTKREYNLLMTLIENKNNVVSRDQLLNKIWGPESNIELTWSKFTFVTCVTRSMYQVNHLTSRQYVVLDTW